MTDKDHEVASWSDTAEANVKSRSRGTTVVDPHLMAVSPTRLAHPPQKVRSCATDWEYSLLTFPCWICDRLFFISYEIILNSFIIVTVAVALFRSLVRCLKRKPLILTNSNKLAYVSCRPLCILSTRTDWLFGTYCLSAACSFQSCGLFGFSNCLLSCRCCYVIRYCGLHRGKAAEPCACQTRRRLG